MHRHPIHLLSWALLAVPACTMPRPFADTGVVASDAFAVDTGIRADAFTLDGGGGSIDANRPDTNTGAADADLDASVESDVGADAGLPPPPPTTFAFTGLIESYTVPAGITQLHILAEGASGGDAEAFVGGFGAHVEVDVTVAPGEVLEVLVGQQPAVVGHGDDGCGASGGGGSFVARGVTPLIAAGGGGGASAYSTYAHPGGDASTAEAGESSGTYVGGVSGNGGGAPMMEGGGGGGFSADGANGEGHGGIAYTAGGSGGVRATTEGCTGADGGFGGGGGGGNDLGAGGGGYSGGAAQSDLDVAPTSGGGGSFGGTASIRADHGHGRIVITPL